LSARRGRRRGDIPCMTSQHSSLCARGPVRDCWPADPRETPRLGHPRVVSDLMSNIPILFSSPPGPIPPVDGTGPEQYFCDLYIPSYTHTLSALMESRKPILIAPRPSSLLLVAYHEDNLGGVQKVIKRDSVVCNSIEKPHWEEGDQSSGHRRSRATPLSPGSVRLVPG
jgi:hypothetical protein